MFMNCYAYIVSNTHGRKLLLVILAFFYPWKGLKFTINSSVPQVISRWNRTCATSTVKIKISVCEVKTSLIYRLVTNCLCFALTAIPVM